MLEAVAIVACFQNMAVVGQAVQQGRSHLGVAKHAGPFAKAQVGGDHHAGAFVKRRQQMEQ